MPENHVVIPDLNAQVEPPKDGILSRTLHSDEKVRLVIFGFDAGQELTAHTAPMPATIEILRGEARITLGGETVDAKPGVWIYMPPLLEHAVYAITPTVMLLTMIKAAKQS